MQRRKLIIAILCVQAIVIILLSTINKSEPMIKIILGLCVLLFISECSIMYNELYRNPDARWWKLLKAYRAQRHDFHNHLQIIYGMIQLKKYDRMINYINSIKKNDYVYDRICHLDNPMLICSLLEVVNLFRQFEIDVMLDVEENVNIKRVPTADLIKTANTFISKLNETVGPKKVRIVLNKNGVEFSFVNEDSVSA